MVETTAHQEMYSRQGRETTALKWTPITIIGLDVLSRTTKMVDTASVEVTETVDAAGTLERIEGMELDRAGGRD